MGEAIIPVKIEEEMKRSYIDYAMSVIVGRALPDVRDGLKPVHRRILFAMYEMGMFHNKPYKKSARIVGEVLGKYHPHGDQAVYDALVRMAQSFNMRYPLIDGQGNFGSLDGDSPAAMRYTEVRLSKIAEELLEDIDKETVEFVPNFDDSLFEPSVLPAKLPNLLINGSSGIAVGMATNMPPHNLGEIVDGIIKVIENPEIEIEELMKYVKGPDFPTGGVILGDEELKKAYLTGRGTITIRGKTKIEKNKIIITELPYQVNKSRLVENIAECIKNRKIEGITSLRDESDREGIRIVLELSENVDANIILNRLFKFTQLQSTFGIINLALVNGEPKILSLKDLINEYLKHRKEIITKRTEFELKKSEKRKHILEGLIIALKNIDKVIEIIKRSKDIATAKSSLMEEFNLTEIQSQAILDMRLQKITALEKEKIWKEMEQLKIKISELKQILENESIIFQIIKKELLEIKEKYSDERRTEIVKKIKKFEEDDLIPDEPMIVILTKNGYIKRVPLKAYRTQRRGGKGVTSIDVEEDSIANAAIASTKETLLFFSNQGKIYAKKVYELPLGNKYSKGKALVNIFQVSKDERITTMAPFDLKGKFLFIATKKGIVKKTKIDEFLNIWKSGKKAIELETGDEVIGAKVTSGDDEVLIATSKGKALRFSEKDVRATGRSSRGVKGISLSYGDRVIGMDILKKEKDLLTVTRLGYGKRTSIEKYPLHKRGGKGVINARLSNETGGVVGVKMVDESDEIIIFSEGGMCIRIPVTDIPKIGRNSKGVKLMRLIKDEVATIVSLKVPHQ